MPRFKLFLSVALIISALLSEVYSPPKPSIAATAISPLDYAKMSLAAYNDEGTGAPAGWVKVDSSRVQSYFGIAFRNSTTGDIVIAHRGTEIALTDPQAVLGDIYADAQLALDSAPDQFDDAKALTQRVQAAYPTAYIYQTGHSLGGTLAELTALYFGTTATTFESPGSASIASGGVGNASITSYQGAPNAINTINPHLGTLILLEPDWEKLRVGFLSTLSFVATIADYIDTELSVKDVIKFLGGAYVKFTAYIHSMDRIITLFDPATGLPRQGVVVSDWPRGIYEGLATFIVGDTSTGTVLEILKTALIRATGDDIFVRAIVLYMVAKSTPLDLVFVIDATASMADDIEQVKAAAITVTTEIAAISSDYRIAIVLYKDKEAGHPFVSQILQPFTTNPGEVIASILSITLTPGQSTPEAVYSGLMTAINLPYRKGVNKQLILMGDAPPQNPDPEGYTTEDVLRAAWKVDPAVINTLQIGTDGPTRIAFEDLARGSRGLSFVATDAAGVVPVLLQLIRSIPQPTPDQSVFVVDSSPGELCNSLNASQNATVRVTGSIPDGQVFCKVIASNGNVPNPAQIGNSEIINKGVISAVDVYGFAANGQSVTTFSSSMQLCLLGQGAMFFMNAAQTPRFPQQLPTLSQGGYTCATFSQAGTFVLTSGSEIMRANVSTVSQHVDDCFASTKAIVNLREEPNLSAKVMAQLPYNDFRYTATEYVPGWYRIIFQDTQGWVSERYLFVYGTCTRN